MLPDRNDRLRPAANQAESSVNSGDTHTVPPSTLDSMSRAVLTDVFLMAQRSWWLKRAQDFRNAAPVPGEYTGNATREQLSQRWRWCMEVAAACEAKAAMVGIEDELEHLLSDVA